MKNTDDISDAGYCIMATEKIGSDYIIVEEDSLLNGKLSAFRTVQDHHITGDRPFNEGDIRGVTTSLTKYRDREQIEIQLPLNDWTDIDFNNLITTGLGNIEPWDLKIKLNQSAAILKGRF
jgi:hypothetical protein